jgi:MFS family permease
MSLCAFAMVSSEFLPVSLLTLMADDLGVSEGAVGQGISISGLFALLTALSIPSLAGNLNRRLLLLGLTGVMVLSALLVGFASNYNVYMAGRILVTSHANKYRVVANSKFLFAWFIAYRGRYVGSRACGKRRPLVTNARLSAGDSRFASLPKGLLL